MTIGIDLVHELDKLGLVLNRGVDKANTRAYRKSLGDSLKFMRARANEEARKEVALKKGEINKEWFKTFKRVRGSNITTMLAILYVKKKPVSMIRLVRGSKQPRKQKGIKPTRRRKLRVEVKKGRVITRSDLFIARVRVGKRSGDQFRYQVFRRGKINQKGAPGLPIVRQSEPSVNLILEEAAKRNAVLNKTGDYLVERWQYHVRAELLKQGAKVA